MYVDEKENNDDILLSNSIEQEDLPFLRGGGVNEDDERSSLELSRNSILEYGLAGGRDRGGAGADGEVAVGLVAIGGEGVGTGRNLDN